MFYRLVHSVLKPVTHAIYRPHIDGIDNVPRRGPVILASNHLSFIDSFVIPLAAPRQVAFLAKAEYFTGTGVAGAIRREMFEAVGAIPVDRDSSRAAQQSLEARTAVQGTEFA